MVDLVKQWKEAARRDDVLASMVPSDIRQLVGEIERLRAALKRLKKLTRPDATRATGDLLRVHEWVVRTASNALGSDSAPTAEGTKGE